MSYPYGSSGQSVRRQMMSFFVPMESTSNWGSEFTQPREARKIGSSKDRRKPAQEADKTARATNQVCIEMKFPYLPTVIGNPLTPRMHIHPELFSGTEWFSDVNAVQNRFTLMISYDRSLTRTVSNQIQTLPIRRRA